MELCEQKRIIASGGSWKFTISRDINKYRRNNVACDGLWLRESDVYISFATDEITDVLVLGPLCDVP
jgi:hypothetical protein